jgi:prepilin-type N-terminal cleavage/methylation domain-containing protein
MVLKATLNSESGVTLVELMVVVLIIAIIISIAAFSPGSANEQLKRQNAARELKVAFERARFDSVKRRADATGNPAVPHAFVRIDTATQFTLVTDANQDGDLIDAGDSVATTFPANISLAPRTGLTLPVTVSFNRRGEPSLSDPSFVVCNGTCTFADDTASIASIVHVTATGTVNLLPGGSAVPSFAVPSITTVDGNTSIRSEIFISPTP